MGSKFVAGSQIVEETLAPGASASIVARQHDVNANQLFMWRRQIPARRIEQRNI